MARLTHSSTRPTGYNGSSLPPRTGGGDDGRSGRDSGDSMPNYGERLRRARLGLAVAMTPILMLFISFTAAYLVRRGFLTFDLNNNTYVRTWLPVELPWPWLLANTAVLILSSITIEFARRDITRQSALAPVQSIPGVSLGKERHVPWLGLTTCSVVRFWPDSSFSGTYSHPAVSTSTRARAARLFIS